MDNKKIKVNTRKRERKEKKRKESKLGQPTCLVDLAERKALKTAAPHQRGRPFVYINIYSDGRGRISYERNNNGGRERKKTDPIILDRQAASTEKAATAVAAGRPSVLSVCLYTVGGGGEGGKEGGPSCLVEMHIFLLFLDSDVFSFFPFFVF